MQALGGIILNSEKFFFSAVNRAKSSEGFGSLHTSELMSFLCIMLIDGAKCYYFVSSDLKVLQVTETFMGLVLLKFKLSKNFVNFIIRILSYMKT